MNKQIRSIRVYGVWVPAEKAEKIKHVADLLVGETDISVPIREVRTRAVKVAIQALIQMNPNASWFLEMF